MNRREADAAFDRSFDDLAAIAHRVAFRLLGTRAEAEDVAQETLVRAYTRWRRVQSHAEPWVARVATNLALDALRRRSRRPTTTLDHAADAHGASTVRDSLVTERLELGRLLAELPRRQREVVVLRYLADRTEADTAAELGTSIGSVKQHAHRGLAALRTAWADLDPLDALDPLLDPVPEPGGS